MSSTAAVGDPRRERDAYSGSENGPEDPFPLKLEGPVIKGFGRGSAELGIPTANIPITGLSIAGHSELKSGVYFGFASLPVDKTTGHPIKSSPSPSSAQKHSSANQAVDPLTSSTPATAAQKVPEDAEWKVYPMVMSLGYNPFYQNTVRSVEVHIIHSFPHDFYNAPMKLLMLGFIRTELDYVSKEALIEDIRTDIAVAERSLEREKWKVFGLDGWLLGSD